MTTRPPAKATITKPLDFDSVVVGELRIADIGPSPRTMAKWAFFNSNTGSTHGGGVHYVWSTRSLELLHKLAESVANDIVEAHTVLPDAPSPDEDDFDPTKDNPLIHHNAPEDEAGWDDDDGDDTMNFG